MEEVGETRAQGPQHTGDREARAHEAEVLGVGVAVLLEEARLLRLRARIRGRVRVGKVSRVKGER